MLFRAKLDAATTTSETGQTLTTDASVTYLTYKGVPCASFSGSGGIQSTTLLAGNCDRSMSIWTYSNAETSSWLMALLHGGNDNGKNFGLYKGSDGNLDWSTSGTSICTTTSASGAWHHFAATWDFGKSELKLYVDGVLKNTESTYFEVTSELVRIGTDWVGYLAEARIYNKVLSLAEIAELATQFQPTT